MIGKQSSKILALGKMRMNAAVTQVMSLGRCHGPCGHEGREEGGCDAGRGHLFSVLLVSLFAGFLFLLFSFLFLLFTGGKVSCVPENAPPDKT